MNASGENRSKISVVLDLDSFYNSSIIFLSNNTTLKLQKEVHLTDQTIK